MNLEINKYVFGPDWFKKHQAHLLRFVNSWLGKRFFRLHGTRSGVGKQTIRKIGPHFIEWENKDGTLTREVRTHNKYSKRLYYQLYPVWYAMHTWDMAIANVFAPQLNLGFDTLTLFPDPSTGATTVDGVVGRVVTSEAWGTIRAGAGTNVDTSSTSKTAAFASGAATTNTYGELDRGFFLFDTSGIPSTATISAATLALFGTQTINNLGFSTADAALAVISSNPASSNTLVAADFSTIGSTRFATDFAFASFSTSGYNKISLNASGISNISTSSISKFATALAADISNTTPAWNSGGQIGYAANYADQTGANNDPYLQVTYTTPTNSTSARQIYYTNDVNPSTVSSNVYANRLSLTYTPQANTTYYYFSALMGSPASSNLVQQRLQNTTSNTTLGEVKETTSLGGDYLPYFTLASESFGASPATQTIAQQVASSSNGTNITTTQAQLFIMQAGSGDQYAVNDTDNTNGTSTWNDQTTLTFTPATAGIYYIFAFAEVANALGSGDRYGVRAIWGSKVLGEMLGVNQANLGYDPFMSINQVKLPNTSQTFKIQWQNTPNFGDLIHIRRARILAIPASSLAQSSYAEYRHSPDIVSQTQSQTYADFLTNTFTPSVSGKNWVTFFQGSTGSSSGSTRGQAKFLQNGTVVSEGLRAPNNTADINPVFGIYQSQPSGSQIMKTQIASSSGTTTYEYDTAILAFQTDAGGGQSLSVKANIKVTQTQNTSVKGDIFVVNNTKATSAKANVIIANNVQAESAKADIKTTPSQDQSIKSNILRSGNTPLMSNGNSLKYDPSTSDYLSIATGTNIPISNQTYSVVAFVKPTAISSTNGVIGWGNFGTLNAVTAMGFITTGIKHWWYSNDLSVQTSNFNDGNWHVIVIEFDGTTRSTWLDGISQISDTPSGHAVPNASQFTIGTINQFSFFKGLIGPVAIYNRALTGTEIKNAIIGALPSSGRVALWQASEGSGTTVADSISGNTASFQGSPTWQPLSAPAGPNAVTVNILQANTLQVNSVKANILVKANTQDNSVKSDIKVTALQNQSVKANIMQIWPTSAKADVLVVGTTQNQSVKADILLHQAQNNSVKAALIFLTFQNAFVKADILATLTQNNSAKSDIKVTSSQNESVKSAILNTTPQNISVKADIKTTTTQNNSAKANTLIIDNTDNNSVKAQILGARPNLVKGNIRQVGFGQNTSAKASITSSGGVDNNVVSHIQRSPMNKTYEYRVYDTTGNTYISSWSSEVLTDPNFRTVINGGPGEMVVQLARKFDDFGEGKDVNLDNIVQCWCFDNQAPNGVMIYAGYISGYRPIFDGGSSTGVDEYIEITLLHEVARLSALIMHDNTQATYISMSGVDPSQMFINSLQYAQTDGSLVKYTAGSVTMTNTSQVYIFNAQSVKDAFDRIIELTPIYWYWTIDPSNLLQVHQSNLTLATHTFLPGKDIVSMDTWRRTEDMVNTVYFIGAGTPPLYYLFKNNGSILAYGIHAIKIADTRVKQYSTALAMAQREIDTKKDPEIRTTLTIADNNGINVGVGYDIESVQVGQTLRIRNLKQGTKTISFWDQFTWDQDVWDQTLTYAASDILQIQAIEYTPDYINIEASSRQPEITRRIEQVYRDTSQAIESDVGTTPASTTQV